MRVIVCSECGGVLTPHCFAANDSCDWLMCRNTDCAVVAYDLGRGTVLDGNGVRPMVG